MVESGRFDWNTDRFPPFGVTTPSYGDIVWSGNFGEYAFLTRLRAEQLRDIGPALSAHSAFLFAQGVETLSFRMQAHVDNARIVAEWLDQDPRVEFVNWAGLPEHQHHERAAKYLPKGPGSVFSLGVKGGRDAGRTFIESVELASHLANIDDAKTLVIHPASTTHAQLTPQLVNGLTCEMPASSPLARLLRSRRTWVGPDAKARLRLLRNARSIAIVGASANPARSSYFVATYLLSSSPYRVYFVNPNADTILGQPVYPDLASLPEVPDIVDVFRKPSDIPAVVDEVVAVGAPTIWMQLGIWNEEAARYAESEGLNVVMDRCVKIEHARFHGNLHLMGFDTGVISAKKAVR